MSFLTVADQFRFSSEEHEELQKAGIVKGAGDENVPGYNSITKAQLYEAYQPNGVFTADMFDAYIDLICGYLNEKDPLPAKHLPRYLNFRSMFWSRITMADDAKRPRGLPWGTEQLRKLAPDITKEERRSQLFHQVENIVIPIEREKNIQKNKRQERWHAAIIIVSMPNKRIEYFDGLHYDSNYFLYHILRFLKYELRELFVLEEWSYRKNINPKQELSRDANGDLMGHIYTEEKDKEKEAARLAQLAERYKRGIDCAIHASTNAFNYLFGLYGAYGQPQFNSQEHIRQKRQRIVADLVCHELRPFGIEDLGMSVKVQGHLNELSDSRMRPTSKRKLEGLVLRPIHSVRKHFQDPVPMSRHLYIVWAIRHGPDMQRYPPEGPDTISVALGMEIDWPHGIRASDKVDPEAVRRRLIDYYKRREEMVIPNELERDYDPKLTNKYWDIDLLLRGIYEFYQETVVYEKIWDQIK